MIRKHAKGGCLFNRAHINSVGTKYRVNLTTNHPYIFNTENLFSVNQVAEYDLTINLDDSYEHNPKQHILTAYINEVKKRIQDDIIFRSPEIQFTEDEKNMILNLAKEPFVIINIDPSGYYKNTRRVYGIDIPQLAKEIQNKYGFKVVEIGLHNTYGLPKVTLENEREAMMLIAASQLFISFDSFSLHIAGALQKNAIGFFGAVNPDYRLFTYNQIRIFQKGM